jgi:hypothetical protein
VFASTYFRKESFDELRLRSFDSDAPSSPVPAAKLKLGRAIPLHLIFGIFAVVVGVVVFAATKHRYDTRDFVLVNMPVSLEKGHIKTGDFTKSLRGTYSIVPTAVAFEEQL